MHFFTGLRFEADSSMAVQLNLVFCNFHNVQDQFKLLSIHKTTVLIFLYYKRLYMHVVGIIG